MSIMDNPSDPFSEIDVSEFKSTNKDNISVNIVEQDLIKKVAEESNFKSRQPNALKEKIVTKSFSLFPADQDIINNSIRNFMDSYSATPSGSDIIRAALHAFSGFNTEEKNNYIYKHRGRGRK